jgi:hypothetical protein
VADLDNGYCYFGYKESTLSVSNGKDFCKSLSAELLAFENDAQIVGFLKLISSGKQFENINGKIVQKCCFNLSLVYNLKSQN